jgi:hypothetical protein
MTQHENQNVIQIKELCGDKRIGNPLLKRGAMKSDILYLLATPPTRGDKIEIEGISLSATLAHPVLGPALEDFQSRLHWSKNDSLEEGAAGIELFLLAHGFAQTGFPIRTMPAPRRAAEIIWVQTMRRLEPQYRRALRAISSCRDSNLPPRRGSACRDHPRQPDAA